MDLIFKSLDNHFPCWEGYAAATLAPLPYTPEMPKGIKYQKQARDVESRALH